MMLKKYHQYIICILTCLLISSCSRPLLKAQGYIEGQYTHIATSVSGVLKELPVNRGDKVKQGQMLFVLEQQPESDAYQAAIENLKQAIAARDVTAANLSYAKLTYERDKILVPKKAIQQSELDNARSNYNALFAQLAQANANIAANQALLAQSKWTTEQKIIYSPLNASVFDIYYYLGEYTQANQAILSLLAPENIKVIFYVEEGVLGGIHLHDEVSVRCDGCRQSYPAHISFISPSAEYTPPVIYSNETNAKLIYRIEAKFTTQDAKQMHPGQPVTVLYHSQDQRSYD